MTPMVSPGSKLFAVTALIIAAAMLTLWVGMVVVGTVASPVAKLPDAAQAQRTVQSSDGLESAWPVPEAKIQKREKIEDVGPMREGILMGRVFDPEGNPVAGATVALLALGRGGPYLGVNAMVQANPQGWFVLVPPNLMRGRDLALIARHPGHRPACIPFRVEAGFGQRDLELRLQRGYAIAGRITSHDAPVAGATVYIGLRPKAVSIQGIGEGAAWVDGRLEENKVVVKSGVEGRFRADGLGPSQYRLYILPGDSRSVLTHEVMVSTPDTDLEIDVTPAELKITVRRFGEPISGAFIVAQSSGRSTEKQSDAKEATVLRVPADEEVRLSIHDDLSEVHEMIVRAPALGSMRSLDIDLVAVERPSLRIHIPGARAQGIREVEARLVAGSESIDMSQVLEIGAEGDFFLWSTVPLSPRPYLLLVVPLGSTGNQSHLRQSKRMFLRQPQRITLPAAGRLDVEVSVAPGGRFELSFDPGENSASRMEAWLDDASGSKVWAQSWWKIDSGWVQDVAGGVTFTSPEGIISGRNLLRVQLDPSAKKVPKSHLPLPYEILAPGVCRLKIEADGLLLLDHEVVIRAGEITKELVQL